MHWDNATGNLKSTQVERWMLGGDNTDTALGWVSSEHPALLRANTQRSWFLQNNVLTVWVFFFTETSKCVNFISAGVDPAFR